MAAPNTNRFRASSGALGAQARPGSSTQLSAPAHRITARQPKRSDSTPVSGIASSEPPPRHSSSKPRLPSSNPMRALAYGTSGAQADIARPATRKAKRVDRRCCGPTIFMVAFVMGFGKIRLRSGRYATLPLRDDIPNAGAFKPDRPAAPRAGANVGGRPAGSYGHGGRLGGGAQHLRAQRGVGGVDGGVGVVLDDQVRQPRGV